MKRSPAELDSIDRQIINALQEGFPLTPKPYADAATRLALTESELIDRLTRLRESGAITRFGPFFDAAAFGGAFCLCAMEVSSERFESVADQVNARAEVAHNYERSHRLNMWFVLATETKEGIAQAVHAIERETGLAVLQLPKLEEFYIGFRVAA